jgi:hypothetical protein
MDLSSRFNVQPVGGAKSAAVRFLSNEWRFLNVSIWTLLLVVR